MLLSINNENYVRRWLKKYRSVHERTLSEITLEEQRALGQFGW